MRLVLSSTVTSSTPDSAACLASTRMPPARLRRTNEANSSDAVQEISWRNRGLSTSNQVQERHLLPTDRLNSQARSLIRVAMNTAALAAKLLSSWSRDRAHPL